MSYGNKLALPEGTQREIFDVSWRPFRKAFEQQAYEPQTFEEVIIPPNKHIPLKFGEKIVKIVDLPKLAKGLFPSEPARAMETSSSWRLEIRHAQSDAEYCATHGDGHK